MKKFFLILIFFSFQCFSFAQQAGDKIQNTSLNVDLVEKLFLEKLNQYRASQNLSTLTTDAILKKAAEDQAKYQQKIGKLTHFQDNNPKKYSQSDRVLFYNGTHDLTGENCIMIYIGVPMQDKGGPVVTVETYQQAAEALFTGWKNSPPHHQNMITKHYETSGLGFAFNTKTGQLYAAQVFGTRAFVPPSNGLTYNNHTQGIKEYEEKACNCFQGVEFLSAWLANYTQVKGDSVFITSTSLEAMQRLFVNADDGMAIDIVYRDQFNCGLNHNIHGSTVFDGYLLPPVYKADLFKRNRHAKYNAMFSFVCRIPAAAIKPGMQVNTVLIKKGRACSYSYPVEGISEMLPNILVDPRWSFYEGRLQKGHVAFSKQIEFPFEQNSADPYVSDVVLLARLISQFDGAIKKINVTTYSSIEGNAQGNEKLQNKRLEVIRKIIDQNLLVQAEVVSTARENWDLFYKQIKDTEWEAVFAGKSQDETRKIINKNIQDNYIKQWLEEQRVARVELVIDQEYDDETKPSLLHIPLYDAINKGDSVQARVAFTKLIRAFSKGEIPIDRLNVVDIPMERKFVHLVSNAVAAKILLGDIFGYNGVEGDEKSLAYIDEAFKKFPDFVPLKFNRLVWFTHLFYHGIIRDVNAFAQLEAEIKKFEKSGDVDSKTYESLLFNYYLTGSLFYYNNILYAKAYECLGNTKPFLLKGQLKEQEILNVAKYFNQFFDYETSVALLEDGLKRFPDNNDILFLYISTGIFHADTQNQKLDFYYAKVDLYRQRKKAEFCKWIETNYQLIREDGFKERFCKDCSH